MRFALVDNMRVEANHGLIGICPGCSQPVVSKCGDHRIHHWAHKSNKNCDNWWESETEWHRAWKSQFPAEWQECFLLDEQTGEKHIADIRSKFGFVIELQHSAITPEEKISRERFYKNMVWVVDGSRLKKDWYRFIKNKDKLRNIDIQGAFFLNFPEEVLPNTWLDCSVPVLFDFSGCQISDDYKGKDHEFLWCLLPERIDRDAMVIRMARKDFIYRMHNMPMFFKKSVFDTIKIFQEYRKKQHIKWDIEKKEQERICKIEAKKQRRDDLINSPWDNMWGVLVNKIQGHIPKDKYDEIYARLEKFYKEIKEQYLIHAPDQDINE